MNAIMFYQICKKSYMCLLDYKELVWGGSEYFFMSESVLLFVDVGEGVCAPSSVDCEDPKWS